MKEVQSWLEGLRDVPGGVVSPDGTLGVGRSWRMQIVPQREGGRIVGPTPGHASGVTAVAISPDGARVLSAGGDGILVTHDVPTRKDAWVWPSVGGIEDESPTAAVITQEGTAVVAWSAEVAHLAVLSPAGEPLGGDALGANDAQPEALSPSRQLVALRPSRKPRRIVDRRVGKPIWIGEEDAPVLAISDQGIALIQRPRNVDVVDVRRKLAVAPIPVPGGPTAAALSRDGLLALVGGGDETVGLWDLKARREVARIDLRTSADVATALAVGPDARSLVVGTARGVVLRFERVGASP